MIAQLRSHPENSQEEIQSLLSKLPKNMQDKVELIRQYVRNMTPAGLSVFVQVLKQEVDIIISGENSFEKRIAYILRAAVAGESAANDEKYNPPTYTASNDDKYETGTQK